MVAGRYEISLLVLKKIFQHPPQGLVISSIYHSRYEPMKLGHVTK